VGERLKGEQATPFHPSRIILNVAIAIATHSQVAVRVKIIAVK